MRIQVGIVGVTGYSGQELLKILLRHPAVSVRMLASLRIKESRSAQEQIPWLPSDDSLRIEPFRLSRALDRCDLFFLALPHGSAMRLAPQLLRKKETQIIDLSGDFRLKSAGLFAGAYGIKHASPSLLQEAVYGLPEINRKRLVGCRLVANPGCYPTAALLAAAPLAEAGWLADGLIVDAKSGVTGAGRALKEELLFSEVNEDFRAYKVDKHPHTPEMEQALQGLSRKKIPITFVPHLAPMNRGLYATLYAPLNRSRSESQIRALFQRRYRNEPFIRLLPGGGWPQVKTVAGTNLCQIGLRVEPGGKRAILLSAIDNLGKGAAGQAVQNMNLIQGLPETTGLGAGTL